MRRNTSTTCAKKKLTASSHLFLPRFGIVSQMKAETREFRHIWHVCIFEFISEFQSEFTFSASARSMRRLMPIFFSPTFIPAGEYKRCLIEYMIICTISIDSFRCDLMRIFIAFRSVHHRLRSFELYLCLHKSCYRSSNSSCIPIIIHF